MATIMYSLQITKKGGKKGTKHLVGDKNTPLCGASLTYNVKREEGEPTCKRCAALAKYAAIDTPAPVAEIVREVFPGTEAKDDSDEYDRVRAQWCLADRENITLRAQIAALAAERDALRGQVQTMAFALEPFMEFYDHHSEVEWLDARVLWAMLDELDWSDFKAASEAFDKPKS